MQIPSWFLITAEFPWTVINFINNMPSLIDLCFTRPKVILVKLIIDSWIVALRFAFILNLFCPAIFTILDFTNLFLQLFPLLVYFFHTLAKTNYTSKSWLYFNYSIANLLYKSSTFSYKESRYIFNCCSIRMCFLTSASDFWAASSSTW